MHLRGKAFRYDLYQPDSSHRRLVDVPRFDFNWQHIYVLAEPLPVRRGAIVHCTGWFDNSPQNPTNPNPSEVVRWGDQIWEEMMIGYILLAFERDVVEPEIRSAAIERAQRFERRRVLALRAALAVAALGVLAAAAAVVWRRAG